MSATWKIVILDDEPERIQEMVRWLSHRCPDADVVVFDNAPDMIDWLEDSLEESRMICLDHDLGPNRCRDGRSFDPGTGRERARQAGPRFGTASIMGRSVRIGEPVQSQAHGPDRSTGPLLALRL
jgi:hypothetical protein